MKIYLTAMKPCEGGRKRGARGGRHTRFCLYARCVEMQRRRATECHDQPKRRKSSAEIGSHRFRRKVGHTRAPKRPWR